MTMSVTVVYVADTGHAVGALALTGAEAATDVESLIGRALPLRVAVGEGGTVSLPLSSRRLAVLNADDEPGVLAEPLAFGVELTADGRPRPTLLRLASWRDGVTLATNGLTVELPLAAGRATPVVALVSDGQETHVLAGEIPAQQTRVTLPLTLESAGGHGVLVLAAGWAGRLMKAVPR
ncbi:hypothetical protein FFZ77_16680 [Streptomyces katsurahamanus]|uniref:Uncharacterized protein n=2 Tax=Streptomyces katsurahamanus TaxID=2577098 RepID=A0ABW9NV65_9ACTN|nr:hypothetical protein [Streptomyces katsurahamanus]